MIGWKRVLVMLSAIVVAAAVPRSAAMAEPLRIAIVSRTVFYVPLWIAQRRGFFSAQGIDAAIEVFDSAERIDEALRAGAVQVAISTPEGPIIDAYRGGALRIVAGNARRLPHFIIARPGTRTLQDLRGANFGVLSLREGTTYLVHEVARVAGLRPDDYRVTAVGGAPTRWRLLREGTIDAGLQPFPLSYEAEAAGFANLGPIASHVPDWQFTSVNVNDTWARGWPELVAAFLRALAQGQAHMTAHPDEAAEVAAQELRTEITLARRAIEDTRRLGILSDDLSVSEAGLARVFDALQQGGHIAGAEPFAPGRVVAPNYLRLSRDMRVRDIGSAFVGGGTAVLSGLPARELRYAQDAPPLRVDPNGTYAHGQIYAQYVRLAAPRRGLSIVFLNGGTSTGALWETTPDGRPGWQSFFLRDGYDAWLTDAVGKGRASWARFPEIFPGEPVFRPNEETWTLLRMGPRWGEAFPNVQFPVERFDDFAKQGVPRFAGFDGRDLEAYDALLRRVGRAVLVAQSSGAYLAIQLAARHPDLVRAVVGLELTSAPDLGRLEVGALARVPQLLLWGDNLEGSPTWQRIRMAADRYVAELNARGGRVEVLDLPRRGIRGNTHQLMMDRNSDALALEVARWLEERLP